MRRLMLMMVLSIITQAPVHATRPNVLFVFTDDQAFDTVRALGNEQIHTPTLDSLVKRGFSFTNAYCQGGNSPAVCVPSRTQLLSGRSVFRTPAPNLKTYDGATLGKSFRDAGYATLCVSKPGNSFRAAHDHFETVVHQPHSGAETSRKAADAVLDFLQHRDDKKPFLIYMAHSMPHDPRTAEPEYSRLYDPAKLQLPKNYMPRQPLDIGVLAIRDEKLAAYPRDEITMRKHLADYYACITGIDHHLGRILTHLERQDQLKNTIIIYTSDQGLAVGGRHGLMGKQNLYEHFKSPLIIAGPAIAPGQSKALVYLYDLYPTACELAGVRIPETCDGKSLSSVMNGQQARVRDSLFAVYMDTQRMVRNERWKLIWYSKIHQFQLFDLENDPHELSNLASEANHDEQLRTMKRLMATQQELFKDSLPRVK